MDVIVLGFYNSKDADIVEDLASKNNLRVVWNYQQFNIDSEIGIVDLKNYFNLYQAGILIENNLPDEELFSSYTLIYEVSDYFMATEWDNKTCEPPKLFNFFNALNRSNIQKIIMAFADEWNENSTVKIEKLNFGELKNRLYSPFVWCYGYRNLKTNPTPN